MVNGVCGRQTYIGENIRKLYIEDLGKANALNVGIESAKYEYICVLDADCILADNATKLLLKNFNDEVFCIGGKLKAISDKEGVLAFVQRLEYMKAFNITRSLFNSLEANCLISGAFGLFRKDELFKYNTNTVGEDMELILSLNKQNKKIVYDASSVCYTLVPTDLKRLFRQRDRWQRGLLDCLIKHKDLIFNPKYKYLGCLVLPYEIIFELLGPIFILLSLVFFNINIYLFYLLFETIVCLIAEYIEYKKAYVFISKLPECFIGTILLSLLSIPLSVVRLYGMLTFKRRRMVW